MRIVLHRKLAAHDEAPWFLVLAPCAYLCATTHDHVSTSQPPTHFAVGARPGVCAAGTARR
jgi:hypothetical protein